jgi:hypothetical protein
MTEKRPARRDSRHHLQPEPTQERGSSSKLARGSSTAVTSEQLARVSQPRIPSRTPISVFQLDGEERQSASELTAPRVKPPSERPYLIAVIALLFGVVAVLAFLVLI